MDDSYPKADTELIFKFLDADAGVPTDVNYKYKDSIQFISDNVMLILTTMASKCEYSEEPFPADKILVWASDRVYEDNPLGPDAVKKKEIVPDNNFVKMSKQEIKNWSLLCVAFNEGNDYFGCALMHKEKHQLIVAHRGTKFSKTGSIITDLKGIVKNEFTSQMTSACTFILTLTKALREIYTAAGTTGSSPLKKIQMSITGHSLGGWLAQLTTFAAKYLEINEELSLSIIKNEKIKSCHAHCVTFDSPGAKNMLDIFNRLYNNAFYDREVDLIGRLDIRVYLGNPNIINMVNEQVGELLQIDLRLNKPELTWWNLEWVKKIEIAKKSLKSHYCEYFTNAFCNNNEVKKVGDWPFRTFRTGDAILTKKDKSINKGWLEVVKLSWEEKEIALQEIGDKKILSALVAWADNQDNTRHKLLEYDENLVPLSVFNDLGLELLRELRSYFCWKKHCSNFKTAENLDVDKEIINSDIKWHETGMVSIESTKKVIIGLINRITPDKVATLKKFNNDPVTSNQIILYLESERYLQNLREKYFKVEFKKNLELDSFLSGGKNLCLCFDSKYPLDYVRLQILNSISSCITDLYSRVIDGKIVIVKAELLIDLAIKVKVNLYKKIELLIVDCLSAPSLKILEIIDSVNFNEPSKKRVLLIVRGETNISKYDIKVINLDLQLTENFIKCKEFQSRQITFQGRGTELSKVFIGLNSQRFSDNFSKALESAMSLFETKSEIKIGSPPPSFFDMDNNYIFIKEKINVNIFKNLFKKLRKTSIFVVNFEEELAKDVVCNELCEGITASEVDLKFYRKVKTEIDYHRFKKLCKENPDKFVYLFDYSSLDKLVCICCYSPKVYRKRTCMRFKFPEFEILKTLRDKVAKKPANTDLPYVTKKYGNVLNLDTRNVNRVTFELIKKVLLNSDVDAHKFEIQNDEVASCSVKSCIVGGIDGENEMKFSDDLQQPQNIDEEFKKLLFWKTVEEGEILRGESQIKIILDEPGMGKTTTLTKTAEDYFENNKDDWVIRIDLKRIKVIKLQGKNIDTDICNFIANSLNFNNETLNEFTRLALTYRLKFNPSSIILFLDGFDEMLNDCKENLIQILSFLATDDCNPKIKIVLTSRTHEINNFHFKAECYLFEELKLLENFLTDFWIGITKLVEPLEIPAERLREFAGQLVLKAKEHLNKDNLRFLGIPLQMRMLSERNLKPVVNFVKGEPSALEVALSKLSDNIINNYESFLETKFEIYFTYKETLQNAKNISTFKRPLEDDFELLSIHLLADEETKAAFAIPEITERINAHTKSTLLSTGIVVSALGNKCELDFNHRTFAEFYFSRFILKKIRKMVLVIEKNCYSEDFLKLVRQLVQKYGNYKNYKVIANFLNQRIKMDKEFRQKIGFEQAEKRHKVFWFQLNCFKNWLDSIVFPFPYSSFRDVGVTPFTDNRDLFDLIADEKLQLKHILPAIRFVTIFASLRSASYKNRRRLTIDIVDFNGSSLKTKIMSESERQRIDLKFGIKSTDFYKIIKEWLGRSVYWVEWVTQESKSVIGRIFNVEIHQNVLAEFYYEAYTRYDVNNKVPEYPEYNTFTEKLFVKKCLDLIDLIERCSSFEYLDEKENKKTLKRKLLQEYKKFEQHDVLNKICTIIKFLHDKMNTSETVNMHDLSNE